MPDKPLKPTCEVHWFSDDVMEFVYRDKVQVADLERVVIDAKALMDERTPRVQLVDTLAVTGVPQEIGSILNDLLEAYRDRGGELVVMIASDTLTAMLGRSMSFGSGIRLELFRNRTEALKFISVYRG